MRNSLRKIGSGAALTLIILLVACQPDTAVSPPTSTLPPVQTATAVPTTTTPIPTESKPIPTASATATLVPPATPIPDVPNQSDGRSNSPVISDDGQVIAFTSTGNLTGNAGWQREAVFVRDLATQTTELINERLDGQASNFPVYGMAMSGNGRVVAYYSHDGDLVPGDEMDCGAESDPVSCEDMFIYDRDTAVTERIPLGRGQGLGGDYTLALSADGRFVAYSFHVFDRETGQTTDIPTIDGARPDGYTFAPRFAGDDRFLAFVSNAANFVPNDNNEQFDVFVWDRESNQVQRVSVSTSGEEGNETSGAIPFHEGISHALTISGDGRFIAYASLATNLTEGVVNECDDYRGFTRACYNIYRHDRQTGETQLTTNNGDGDSIDPALSGDGRFLAFASVATNLTGDVLPDCGFPGIVNCGQIYLFDRESGQISLISRGMNGEGGSQGSWQPDLSADGRYLTFVSAAGNLVPGDTNEVSDIFRLDQQTGTMERASLNDSGSSTDSPSLAAGTAVTGEAILILEPGPGSRVTSPIHVAGTADPTFEQNLVVRLVADDGSELAQAATTIKADLGQRGPFMVDLPFTVSGERQAFIQVYASSGRDGGVTHLAATGVILADSGPETIRPVADSAERITINQPAPEDTIQGGSVHVAGVGLASFEQTLLVELLDAAGNTLAVQPVIVTAPDLGQPGPFEATLSYQITSSQPGRVVVRDVSPAFGGNVHLASVEVILEP